MDPLPKDVIPKMDLDKEKTKWGELTAYKLGISNVKSPNICI